MDFLSSFGCCDCLHLYDSSPDLVVAFIRELLSCVTTRLFYVKMADAKELQTNLTEYRAQLRQASYFWIHS